MKEARKLAKHIFSENKKGRSYRVIAREDYPGLKAGTLNRFSKSRGEYIPKDKNILSILGLIKVKEKKKIDKPDYIKAWDHLPREERHQVIKEYLKWKGTV